MKLVLSVAALAFSTATVVASSHYEYAPFGARHFPYEPFGVYKATLEQANRGDVTVVKSASSKDSGEAGDEEQHEDAFHRAQDRIMHSVEVAEKMLLHAVEDEVDNLFHDLPKHDEQEKVVEVSSKITDEEDIEGGEPMRARKGWHIDEAVKGALHAMEEGYIE